MGTMTKENTAIANRLANGEMKLSCWKKAIPGASNAIHKAPCSTAAPRTPRKARRRGNSRQLTAPKESQKPASSGARGSSNSTASNATPSSRPRSTARPSASGTPSSNDNITRARTVGSAKPASEA